MANMGKESCSEPKVITRGVEIIDRNLFGAIFTVREGTRIVITDNGAPVAALVSMQDFAALPHPDTPISNGHEFKFTPRQYDVVALIAEGRSNAAISDALFISGNTTKYHLNKIYQILGAHSRVEAAIKLRDVGILPPKEPINSAYQG